MAQVEISGFPVVQLDESARVAALGGRSPALATDDVSAVFSNPAMLSLKARNKLSLSYLNHVGSVNAAWLSYARGLDSLTTVAIGIRYLGFGSFDRADDQGSTDGTFNASDLSLTIGASRRFRERINFGANVHYLLSSMAADSVRYTGPRGMGDRELPTGPQQCLRRSEGRTYRPGLFREKPPRS